MVEFDRHVQPVEAHAILTGTQQQDSHLGVKLRVRPDPAPAPEQHGQSVLVTLEGVVARLGLGSLRLATGLSLKTLPERELRGQEGRVRLQDVIQIDFSVGRPALLQVQPPPLEQCSAVARVGRQHVLKETAGSGNCPPGARQRARPTRTSGRSGNSRRNCS